nr:pro Pol polyprotein [Hymenolepis microstoma]
MAFVYGLNIGSLADFTRFSSALEVLSLLYLYLMIVFWQIRLDIVGHLSSSNASTHNLACIDHFTSFLIVILLSSISPESVANALVEPWMLMCRYPVCNHDRLGITFHFCFVSTIEPSNTRWNHSLPYSYQWSCNISERPPIIQLAVDNAMKKDIACCPAELVFGSTLNLPGEMIFESQDKDNIASRIYSATNPDLFALVNNRSAQIPNDLSTCPFVFA